MRVPIISSLINYFKIFHTYAGNKLFYFGVIVLFGGLGESIGFTLLLPILDFNKPQTSQDGYTQLIYNFLNSIGIKVSLLSLLILLFLSFVLKGLFVFAQSIYGTYITTSLVKSLRIFYLKRYKNMNYEYFAKMNIGYLNNLITVEITRAVHGLGKYIDLMVSTIYILIYSAVALLINWKASIVVFTAGLLVFWIFRILSKLARKFSILVSEKNAEIQSMLIQMIQSFKYLKATNSFSKICEKLENLIDKHRAYTFKTDIIPPIPEATKEPIAIVIIGAMILYYVGYKGQSISSIIILLLFFYKIFTMVFAFQTSWQKFWGTIGGVEVLQKMEKELNENFEEFPDTFNKINDFKNEIILKNVNFSYGNKQVLFDININIPKNKMIAFVGESGSGKTTLFDIITGLLISQKGEVTIDEGDYKKINLLSLRSHFGYVTQDPVIFNDTVANNITLWEGDSKDTNYLQRIKEAATLAHCAEFIDYLENKYDSILGDKGVCLSGGQRQRIAIARELFKNPEIMIFDEATSALDTESEQLIQKSIDSMMGKRTMIIAAHRLSTIKNCDYIYVLAKGRVIEEGEFLNLYNNKESRFRKMCKMQFLNP